MSATHNRHRHGRRIPEAEPKLRGRLGNRTVAIGSAALFAIALTAAISSRSQTAASTRQAQAELEALDEAAEKFWIDYGRCPEDIDELAAEGYVKHTGADPWGSAYVVRCTRVRAQPIIAAKTAGPDGIHGTNDDLNSRRM